MELIERYLQAVKFALPLAQQDDIVKELRDSILSQIEDREATLGRPLSEDEQVEVLRKLGSPMHLASRYRKQRLLIGSALFPIYWKVLKAALGVAFLVVAAASVATAAAGRPFSESLYVLFRYPGLALTIFACVTLIFASAEFFGAKFRFSERWDPRKLPPLIKERPRRSNIELIAQLFIQIIFGVWWLAGLHYQFLILGPGAAFINFGPVWLEIYPLFVVLVLVDISFTIAFIYRPQWTEGRNVSRVLKSGLGLVGLIFLIRAPYLFVPANASANSQALVDSLNFALRLGLPIALIVHVINIAVGLTRLIGRRIGRAHEAIV
jgi:hypothetical protein